MKVTYDVTRVRQVAEQAIRKAVQANDNPADLINVALGSTRRAATTWRRCGRLTAPSPSQIDTWEDNLLAETSIRYGTN
jgi:hypothetical protein